MCKSLTNNKKIKKPRNKGFIALISAVLVSAAVMAVALAGSAQIGSIFDEASRKEYRLEATEAGLACLDNVFVELAHDYFYSIAAPAEYPAQNCSVVSVTGSGSLKSVVVNGFSGDPRYHITAVITAQVLQSDNNISLVSETTGF